MAAIVTKEAFEVAVLPTTQQVRVTKAALEAAVLPTTQQVRLTKAAMQVAYRAHPDLLFWEGAEGYQSAQDIRDKWLAQSGLTPASITSYGGVVRTGAKGTRVFGPAGNAIDYLAVSSLATVMVEFWAQPISNASTNCLYITDSSGNVHFKLTRVLRGHMIWRCWDANNAQVGADYVSGINTTWVHIGVKLTCGNSGSLTVRFDDNVWINNVTGDFQSTGSTIGRIGFHLVVGSGQGESTYFDELVVQGPAGTFLGSGVHCTASFPTAAGDTTQWTPSTGSNYQNVDEVDPNDDTDYNSSSTAAQLDLYNVTDLPAFTGNVLGVDVWARMRKDSGGTEQVKIATKVGSTVYYGTTTALTSSYAPYRKQYLVSPVTGGAFTQADVNAIQLGAEVV